MIESAAMYTRGTYLRVNLRPKACGYAFAFALAFLAMLPAKVSWAQSDGSEEKHFTTIRGRVLNQVTKEAIARALVTRGNDYATMTDDRGKFELKIVDPRKEDLPQGNVVGSLLMSRFGTREPLQARKPGFLPPKPVFTRHGKEGQEEATIYLTPEASIVGRVTAAGAEPGGVQCELYVFTTTDGKQR